MVKAISEGGLPNFRCFAHSLQKMVLAAYTAENDIPQLTASQLEIAQKLHWCLHLLKKLLKSFLRKQPPCHWLYLLLGCYWSHGRKRVTIGESAPWKIRWFKVWSQDLLVLKTTDYYQWQPWLTPGLKIAFLVVILQRLVRVSTHIKVFKRRGGLGYR